MDNTAVTYQALEYSDLTEQTYKVLKEKILRRELKSGEQISVPEVALALGVSRTPVTDALKRLAIEGLVEIAPRRGTFVTELTARDLADIFDIRLMIEMYAVDGVFRAGMVDQFLEAVRAPLVNMEEAIAGDSFQNYDTFISNDRDFHTTLVQLAGNKRLLRIYTQLHIHSHTARIHYLDDNKSRQAQKEHKAIVQAFQCGNGDEAKEAVRGHILAVKARIIEPLEKRGGKL